MNRILCIRTHGIGDALLTTPAIRALRNAHPAARIDVMVGSAASRAYRGNPHIDSLIEVPDSILFRKALIRLILLAEKIRAHRYDAVICFSRSELAHAFARFTGIPIRAGLIRSQGGRFLNYPLVSICGDAGQVRYEARDYIELALKLGVPRSAVSADIVLPEIEIGRGKACLAPTFASAPVTMFIGGGRNPGGISNQKRWEPKYFVELANLISKELFRQVTLTGSKEDMEEIKDLLPLFPEGTCRNSAGNPLDMADLLKHSAALVTVDSFPIHIAPAIGCPMVCLFGPTHPDALLPDDRKHIRIVNAGLECSPCFWQSKPIKQKKRVAMPPCLIDPDALVAPCMRNIKPWMALDALKELLNTEEGCRP